MGELFTWTALLSLITLTVMEIVLGIDNIVFLSIISGKLPEESQAKARNWGLVLALIPRIILLLFISWVVQWDKPLFTLPNLEIHEGQPLSLSGKGIILLIGGIFLLYKSTSEIHHKLEGQSEESPKAKYSSFKAALVQIVVINIIFSFDSILTAVGLVDPDRVDIMIVAVVISVLIMMIFAGKVSRFVNKHPTVKMLALAFLMMIGMLLVLEAFGVHVPKGYVYFAMAFSVIVEMLNLKMRKHVRPVNLKDSYELDDRGKEIPERKHKAKPGKPKTQTGK